MSIEIVSGAAAIANVAAQPFNLMLYGGPGVGKTTEAVKTFMVGNECSAFVALADENGLAALPAAGLPIPAHTARPVHTYEDLCEAAVEADKRGFTGLIVDSLTTWTTVMYPVLQRTLKTNNKWAIPVEMRTKLSDFRDGCRNLGIHVIYVAHAQPPFTDDAGNFNYGGPALTPKTAGALFYPRIDTMLRMDRLLAANRIQRVFYTGGVDWPVGLGPMPSDILMWFQKNREGCNDAVVPADLKGFLSGRQPPYKGF